MDVSATYDMRHCRHGSALPPPRRPSVVAYLHCRHGWSANCAASTAEAIGGGVTTYFGDAGVTLARPGLRVASGFFGFIFDLAAFRSPDAC